MFSILSPGPIPRKQALLGQHLRLGAQVLRGDKKKKKGAGLGLGAHAEDVLLHNLDFFKDKSALTH
jgi:hypothetical protein